MEATITNPTTQKAVEATPPPICKPTPTRRTKTMPRVSYSFAEFSAMLGKERTWTYRQVAKGRIRAITGYGTAMIPASELERIFGATGGAARA